MSYERANLTQVPDDAILPPDIRVFVNERGISLPRGATVLDAVQQFSETEGAALAVGRARVTDSRGLPLDCETVISGGTIMRVLPVREQLTEDSV